MNPTSLPPFANGGRRSANAYGYFRADDAAFVITEVLTPRPWVNVMSNDRYGLVLSQAGGGFSWFRNCQLFRLSRWEQDLVQDDYGRFLYVQDRGKPADVWSTTYQPTCRRAELDEVEHGLGYTTFRREFLGLRVEHTVFVPVDADCEHWIVRVSDTSGRPRRLRLASYLEWQLGGQGDWHREFHRLFMESRKVRDCLVAWKHAGLEEDRRDEPEEPIRAVARWQGGGAVSWVTDKQAWLGRCGSLSSPAGFQEPAAPTNTARWDDPVCVGLFDLDLAAHEERVLAFTLAVAQGEQEALAIAEGRDVDAVLQSLSDTRAYWQRRSRAVDVKTGDPDIDLLANTWLPYQAIAGRLMARCAYYQQGGAYGFRDQLQDSLMLLHSEPAETLRQLGRHAEAMYPDGGVRHWWHPEIPWGPDSRHSDTCLWLAYGTLAYLDATCDTGALAQPYAYLPDRHSGRQEQGDLLDHCLRGIDRALGLRSPRGLPLIGAGDWNDGLSHAGIEGKGESVWLGMFLYDILRRWSPVLGKLGMGERRAKFDSEAEALRAAVNEHGWDGEWYIAGTRDDGKAFGSRENAKGSIFLNPQTWAVISGIAPEDRARQAMESAKKRLVKPYGALLLDPAFDQVDPYIGYITRYAPALRENGGVYSHASTWAVWAFAKLGDMETARAVYRGMLPSLRAALDPELYAAEPYVMPGNADGPDSPFEGRAGWTWYTGSAAWMVRMARLLSGEAE